MFKLDNKIGLGLAALGRPGYINIGHGDNLGRDKSKASMRDYCHQVLDFAYSEGEDTLIQLEFMEMLKNS